MYICYLLTNSVNKKQYIGITCRPFNIRWLAHAGDANRGSNCLLHKAIRKYGKEAFTHVILARDVPLETIKQLEQQMILDHHTSCYDGHGYNMTAGGDGCTRRKLTEEHKQKISQSNKGKHGGPKSPETIERIKQGRRKHTTPTHTTPHTDETKNRLRLANIGKKLSKETRQKMSASRRGKPMSEKAQLARVGRKHSEAARRRMSESKKARDAFKKQQD